MHNNYQRTPEQLYSSSLCVGGAACSPSSSTNQLQAQHFTLTFWDFSLSQQYLGHILGMEGIRPVPAKTEAIKAMHPPVNPKQVRVFLSLVGYYRKFIKNFAKIAKPVAVLTHMDIKFEWKETHRCTFMKLKDTIIQAPILRYLDTTKPYIVYTDASDDACGAQLSQMHEEAELPVAFLSHTFTNTQ